jgi:hypothetical protein
LLIWWRAKEDKTLSLREVYQKGPNTIRDKKRAKQIIGVLIDHRSLIEVPKQSAREAYQLVEGA